MNRSGSIFFLYRLTTWAACAVLLVACNGPQQPAEKKPATAAQKPDTAAAAVTVQTPLTLPLLDALFYEPDFASSLRSKIGLTAVQITKLKSAAHTAVADLSEDGSVDTASARFATKNYEAKITELIGTDKAQQLQQLVAERSSGGVAGLAPVKPNFVPNDTRVVVNAPAFRMDVFQDGKLLKTYRVGIGYPEFPLPTGMRRADTIIFHPNWTPPDEAWVKGKFAPGRKVSGASELNPLGVIKIPIGMPSLIHGGKPLEKIGNFASHGCVGMTNAQVKAFTALLMQLGGSELSAESIRLLEEARAKTHSVKLPVRVPIDLRYETIVAQDGRLHIYRDVYERGTNTLATAKKVLAAYSVTYDQLSEQEKADLGEALQEMNRDAHGKAIAADNIPPSMDGVPASKIDRAKKGKVTVTIKGQREADVPIAALAAKGYPAPVALDNGSGKTTVSR
jgi:lipoprotein-anchoring transpeptidase ErfK/SrfK